MPGNYDIHGGSFPQKAARRPLLSVRFQHLLFFTIGAIEALRPFGTVLQVVADDLINVGRFEARESSRFSTRQEDPRNYLAFDEEALLALPLFSAPCSSPSSPLS
jgi:hypothetical protein